MNRRDLGFVRLLMAPSRTADQDEASGTAMACLGPRRLEAISRAPR
jgi:hypothetical protein